MPRGGARPGAGRKLGTAAQKTAEARDRLAAEGLLPLDYMVGVLRGTMIFDEVKFEAAKAAAPFIHPRLANIEAKVAHDLTQMPESEIDAEITSAATALGLTAH